jgi:hypothetical protein
MNYFGLSENNRLFFDIDIPLNEYNKKLVRGKREVDISNFGDSEHQITITLDSEHLAVYIFVNGIETAKIPFLDTTSSIIELP